MSHKAQSSVNRRIMDKTLCLVEEAFVACARDYAFTGARVTEDLGASSEKRRGRQELLVQLWNGMLCKSISQLRIGNRFISQKPR